MLPGVELRAEIAIDAPPDRVWAVLTDLPGHADWNPFMPHVAGELRPGSHLDVVLCPPGTGDWPIRPEVTAVEPGVELRWKARYLLWGLVRGERFFRLVPADGGTRVLQGEDLRGPLVGLFGALVTGIARGLVYMNQALKRRVEGR